MPVGVVTLGQVAARLDYLDVACAAEWNRKVA